MSNVTPCIFYSIFRYNDLTKTSSENVENSFIELYFRKRTRMKARLYSLVLLLIHAGFLYHALFIIFSRYFNYEIVTSTGRIKQGMTKELPRITICPYYQMEENAWYGYKKVMTDIRPSLKCRFLRYFMNM